LAIFFHLFLQAESSAETVALNDILADYKLQIEKTDSNHVINNNKFKAQDLTFHTLISQSDTIRMEFEIIQPLTPDRASKYIQTKYAIVDNLYDPKLIPYGGAISHDTECPEEMKPTEIAVDILGNKTRILFTSASERNVLGVWEKALAIKKAAYLVVYDQTTHTLFQIILFMDKDTFTTEKIITILKGLKKI